MRNRTFLTLLALAFVSIGSLFVAPMLGLEYVSLSELWKSPDSIDAKILRDIRIPRVLTAFAVGAALALSGMTYQAMFRNPLATPFTLGIASGASLGAALYLLLGLTFVILAISGVTIAALLGSLFAASLVYGLTRLKRGFSTATLLLAGVAVSFFFSSLILFIQYLSGYANSFRIIRWMMGSLDLAGYDGLMNMLPFVSVGVLVVLISSHELNLLATGDDIATSRGVDVNRIKKRLFIATSLMVGGVVAMCGPIGFIGMITPHICRLLVGSNHRILIVATVLFGGTFLLVCDTLARTLIAPVEIPVGVITAMVGGPFFIILLLKKRGGLGL